MFRFVSKKCALIRSYAVPKHIRINFNQFSSVNLESDFKVIPKINFVDETVELKSTTNCASEKILKFPFIWLRDNCQCEKCYHRSSQSRVVNWETLDTSVKPKTLSYDDNDNKLKVLWNDEAGHVSEYEYNWLNERNFTLENQKKYLKTFYRPEKSLVNKQNFTEKLQHFDFLKVIENDLELFNWLHSLIINGISMIENVPQTENEIRKLSNRVSFIKRTHYGDEYTVKTKENTSNVAYLAENLQMHTDMPYYDYAPGANLLHFLVQSKSSGGQNLLVDGFHVVQKMQHEYPQEFETLSKILVNWADIGQENNNHFHSILRAPMICLDYDGNVNRINHSIPQRDSFFSVSIKDVKLWYKALEKFVKLTYAEAFEMKAKEGTILCFDNSRMIHGRRKYKDSKENQRYVIGAFLDWDEIYSRYRVLQKQFQI